MEKLLKEQNQLLKEMVKVQKLNATIGALKLAWELDDTITNEEAMEVLEEIVGKKFKKGAK